MFFALGRKNTRCQRCLEKLVQEQSPLFAVRAGSGSAHPIPLLCPLRHFELKLQLPLPRMVVGHFSMFCTLFLPAERPAAPDPRL